MEPSPPTAPIVLPARPEARRSVRRTFWALLVATFAVKLGLAAAVPVLGDEAYFFLWGANPALGYYDHPPLVGWILAALLAVDDAVVWLRLPSVLLSSLMALGAVALLSRRPHSTSPADAERAYLVGMLFLLLPVHLVGVFVLTDTPLVLFAFGSGAALMRAAEDDDPRWYAVAGAALGLAFLAKYLAVLLGLGYLVWWLGAAGTGTGGPWPDARRTKGFAILVAASLPFVIFNVGWNAEHCWTNVLFNLWSRHAGEAPNYSVPRNLAFYGATHLYMATPPVLWYLVRRRGRLREALARPPFRVALVSFGVPMSILLLFALTSVFGAYWVLAFYPFLFLLLHPVLTRQDLRRSVAILGCVAGLHVLVVAAAVAPLEAWREAEFYRSLVTMERTGELLERIEPRLTEGTHLAATGYSLASLLSFERGEAVSVLGPGSHYARQDDFLTDFRTWDGDRVVVVTKRPVEAERFRPWFASVRTDQVQLHGVTLSLLVGEGFSYPAYRDDVLREALRTYELVPDWLPAAGCPFCEKYFPERSCSGGTG